MKKRVRNEVHGFTYAELERLEYLIERSWNHVAGDMFYDDQGNHDESIIFKQGAVAEIALDADRWRDHCDPEEVESSHDLIKKYFALDQKEQDEVLCETLMYKIYGC